MSDPPEQTILYVDDYAEEREATSHVLRRAGFRVLEAATAGEALQQLKTQSPQLVLLDNGLPDLSGYEVCQKLKSEPAWQTIPVLLLAGAQTESAARVQGLESGADAFLGKPVDSAELLATIKALLRMRRTGDRLRHLVDELDAIVWEADAATGRFTFVSRQAEQLLGYPLECWLSEPDFLRNLMHPDDREVVFEKSRTERAAGRHHELEYRAVGADQRVHWLRDLVHVTNGNGHPPLLRGVIVDITERKQAEEEKALLLAREQAACRRAEEASRLKDEFLNVVSHELRAPLNSIQGWARLLSEGRLEAADAARALETIDTSARTQNRIINDLLDISRIITGRLLLNLRPLAPAQALEAALEAVRPLAATKSVELVTELDQTAGMIYADADRLQQVFWNLLSNAVKFTPHGGRITVEMKRIADTLEIRVKDARQGSASDFLPFMFDPFCPQDRVITQRPGGLGLGLVIARHLVEMHSGTIRVENSAEESSATLVLAFPLLAEATMLQRTPFEADARELDCPPELAGLRVLLATDDQDTRRSIETLLTQCGAQVVTAVSAHEALELMACPAAQRPEILLSEIEMPEMDGYQLVRQLRTRTVAEGGAIPAVALTAQGRVEDRLPALAAGFQMHVAKPVDEAELITVVASLTGRLNRYQEARRERI